MEKDTLYEDRKLSIRNLFKIFLKTDRRRVLITLISGILIFIVLTGISMAAYTYRFNMFKDYMNENANWMSDDQISISTMRLRTGNISFEYNYLDTIKQNFLSLIRDHIPNVGFRSTTTALSAQIYTFDPTTMGPDPYVNNEILTMDDTSYLSVIENSLLLGRMPQNFSELLILDRDIGKYSIGDTVTLYSSSLLVSDFNFTVVGAVRINDDYFESKSVSSDIFNWNFYGVSGFFNYVRDCTFITNFSFFQQIMIPMSNYQGLVGYFVDTEYNLEALQLSKLNQIIEDIPKENEPVVTEIVNYKVRFCPDLKSKLMEFIEFWIGQLIRLYTLNIPLVFIIGLISSAVLNIGSEKLESTFRRMKLHGLSYNTIRKIVLFEDIFFSFISLIGGFSIGIGVSYLSILLVENRPPNYFLDFLNEPILFLLIGTYFFAFFIISFIIHNTIAKKSAKTLSEEFKVKRRRIRNIFSTNEFRLLVIALMFTIVSFLLYYLYEYMETSIPLTINIKFVTIVWFLVSISAVILLTFVFLIFSRLISLFWTFLSKNVLKKNINLGKLLLKQLTVSKKSYQFTILTALIFGLLVLPTALMSVSINSHLTNEVTLNLGESNLVLVDWIDPEDVRDYILEDVDEITNFTEIVVYNVRFYNEEQDYETAYRFNMLGIEDIETFISIVDSSQIRNSRWSYEDVLDLENDSWIMLDKKSAKRHDLRPGDNFYTNIFTRRARNFTVVNSFNNFPLAPLPKKGLFDTFLECLTMVGSIETIKDIAKDVHYSAFVYTTTYKLIKAVSEEEIPTIKEKLQNYEIYDFEELYDKLNSEINPFPMKNLTLYIFLIFAVIIFVGYFTGLKTYQERVRVVEALYRSGATREQILGFFAIECSLINFIPLLISMLLSLPLIRIVAIYSLGIQEDYFHYKPGIPVWLFILILLAGLLVSVLGWLVAMIPQIRGYRPVKQE
ncbi:MAG TPA: FtsX-like permease family protein [candidate division Zixibacteria bacterium]|nr:FtsX-like permease family protein [candidate division Zixibacteria bacterium]